MISDEFFFDKNHFIIDPDLDRLSELIDQKKIRPIYEMLSYLNMRADPVDPQNLVCCAKHALDLPATVFEDILCLSDPESMETCMLYEEIELEQENAEVAGNVSLTVFTAMTGRPEHLRILLEHGFDCNGRQQYYGTLMKSLRRIRGRYTNLKTEWTIDNISPLAAALIALAYAGRRNDREKTEGIKACIEMLRSWPGARICSSSSVSMAVVIIEQEGGMPKACGMDLRSLTEGQPLLLKSVADFCTAAQFEEQLRIGACSGNLVKRVADDLRGNVSGGKDVPEKMALLEKFFPEICRTKLRQTFLEVALLCPDSSIVECGVKMYDGTIDLSESVNNVLSMPSKALAAFFQAFRGCSFMLNDNCVDPLCLCYGHHSPSVKSLDLILRYVEIKQSLTSEAWGFRGIVPIIIEKGNLKLAKKALKKGLFSNCNTSALLDYNESCGTPAMKAIILMGASCKDK